MEYSKLHLLGRLLHMQVRNNICLSLCIFPLETDFDDLLCRCNGMGISEENCRIDIALYPWYYKNLIIVVEKRNGLCQKELCSDRGI